MHLSFVMLGIFLNNHCVCGERLTDQKASRPALDFQPQMSTLEMVLLHLEQPYPRFIGLSSCGSYSSPFFLCTFRGLIPGFEITKYLVQRQLKVADSAKVLSCHPWSIHYSIRSLSGAAWNILALFFDLRSDIALNHQSS